MKKKDKNEREHDPTIFAICFITGIIGSNFIEYGIVSIILGFVIGSILSKRHVNKK